MENGERRVSPGDMQNFSGRLYPRGQDGIPSRPERKKTSPPHTHPENSLTTATRPSLAMLASAAYLSQTRMERFFRNGKPVLTSALLGANFVREGVRGV